MRVQALASDYDGTLAENGVTAERTIEALWDLAASGRKLLLVTGRTVHDMRRVFPLLGRFDMVVAENGAVLHSDGRGVHDVLASPPSERFIAELERLGVPYGRGEVIVGTRRLHEAEVSRAIAGSGADLRIIPNRRSLMVLPSGIDKGTGLVQALSRLDLDPTSVLGIGDGENDLALLRACGFGATVADALASVKAAADTVAEAPNGAGVAEIIARVLATDFVEVTPRAPPGSL